MRGTKSSKFIDPADRRAKTEAKPKLKPRLPTNYCQNRKWAQKCQTDSQKCKCRFLWHFEMPQLAAVLKPTQSRK